MMDWVYNEKTDAAGNAAYINGLCKRCHVNPYQPGCTLCTTCHPEPAERLRRAREATYGAYITVWLSQAEWAEAERFGRLRHEEAKSEGRKDAHGKSDDDIIGLDDHIMGVAGEIVVACHVFKMVDWIPTHGTYSSAPDIVYCGKPIEVRTRGQHDFELNVRPKDRNDWWFVLVTWDKRTPSRLLFSCAWMHAWM